VVSVMVCFFRDNCMNKRPCFSVFFFFFFTHVFKFINIKDVGLNSC
jgi:hypothetical protein